MTREALDGRVAVAEIVSWGGGNAFWAYDHVMAAIPGSILLVPVHRVVGSLRDLCALCPVPYESALAVIDERRQLDYRDLLQVELDDQVRWAVVEQLLGQGAWFVARLPEFRSRVYLHQSGARLAVADELVFREFLKERP